MNNYSLSIQDCDFSVLYRHLIRPDRLERAAYLLCAKSDVESDPWVGSRHRRYLVKKVIPVPNESIISSSTSHVTWDTNSYVSVLKQAQREKLFVAVVHNHGEGFNSFSRQDDSNEIDLIRLAKNRNGPHTSILSIVITPDRLICGRVWEQVDQNSPIDTFRIIGRSIKFLHREVRPVPSSEVFHRQALALGSPFIRELNRLQVAIVGCGGTGSAVAMLLGRLGVGRILLIDKDTVDVTNINRLHGATLNDAESGQFKVDVVKRTIEEIGVGASVSRIVAWVTEQQCQDALKACDVVFGCSDDNQGRLFLNRFSYYYLTPVIDMGLAIELTNTDPPKVQALDGRVTVLFPGNACLLCLGVIDVQRAVSETLLRTDPVEYERQKSEAYVLGEADPSPAVVTFTTEVATMAVNELIQRIQGFRGDAGETNNRVRLFHRMHDLRPSSVPNLECAICGDNTLWGRGDVEPFMDRVE